jgi:hypothetical protein
MTRTHDLTGGLQGSALREGRPRQPETDSRIRRRQNTPCARLNSAVGIALGLGLGLVASCSPTPGAPGTAESRKPQPAALRVREPAVAGLFYPKDRAELERALDGYLATAPAGKAPHLRAIVCPHAGYQYSGPTAAHAYKLLIGRHYETVILLAPSHYAAFRGASVSAADVFRTPLGTVTISPKAKELAKVSPFTLEAPSLVRRPQWATASSRPLPASGEDTPHTWEHSDEVQVPFLQRVLKDFKLIPVVLGEGDPEAVARALAGWVDERTLLVISSDLSHYHSYEQARALDTRCVKAICSLDLEQMKAQEACGKGPIMALMHLARLKTWKARLLDYRNSGDTAGDKSGVVGYAAVAFEGAAPADPATGPAPAFSPAERQQLLELARRSVKEVVTAGKLPEADPGAWPEKFRQPKGCFVTLTKGGKLRGCIGHIVPVEPLYKAVMQNAESAARRDYRFNPVQPNELDQLSIEVSVLTEPQPLAFSSPEDLLARLQPHQDGVVLQVGGHQATFLPQVWEQIPDKVGFLNALAQKAGAPPSAWREPGATVSIYHVEAFKESE